MSTYLTLKYLHIGCVVLSGAGFFVRGLWMLGKSPRLQQPLVRVLPHIVDTVLLASAIAMAVISAQYPFAATWLTAKLIGLLIYIGCGTMALKRGRSQSQRAIFFIAALLAFAYIVAVAVSRNALGPLAWIP
ncbi:MAG: Invasion gene expression up-regulator, SirB [Candidatus Accumulibacter appositus]|uniref:Invasion gene expression up-regulator, SirB n=1 Tax=Candidatus Accumulibacter appositus TaxID=1454003 RepID=A0A011QVA1_9PROT|nr:SirB2 family protein [Accumulibacter sp.]EXI82824.1 MAG: Invasion gene expression up-regulator, SirB [Candidatus Accumulibacter appositus]HRF05075.1 SirB2 family protein [Accumulibacter sp.]